MSFRLTLILLFAASSLAAGVVERTPLTAPVSRLVPSGPGRVVASEVGLFLLHGQRITPAGEVLDAEPVPAPDGYAVSWGDGWRIVNNHEDRLYVRRLAENGLAEVVQTTSASGRLLGVASRANRLGILEYDWHSRSVRLTISDGTAIIAQSSLGVLDGGVIAAFGEGFLVVTFFRSSQSNWDIDGWLFTNEGDLVSRRRIDQIHSYLEDGAMNVATAGDRAIVTVRAAFNSRVRVIGTDLASTGVHDLTNPLRADVSSLVPIALDDAWIVSYTYRSYPGEEHRAVVLSRDGAVLEDVPADPVFSADRVGDRFLVVRPWGDAAIADGDPRTIISPALHLQKRVWDVWTRLDAIVSGEATLVAFGRYRLDWFVRMDADGRPLDPSPQPLPSSTIAATPAGFAFTWLDGSTVKIRRLARAGGWLDSEPMVLADIGSALGFDLVAGDNDMLLAWSTETEILWSRFALDGTPLTSTPDRVAHAPRASYAGTPNAVSILMRGTDRLILVQDTFVCPVLCDVPEMKLEAVAIDQSGALLGAPSSVDSQASNEGVGLADGSWVVSSSSGLLRFARDASLLEILLPVEPRGMTAEMAATSDGWKGVFASPQRIVEMTGTGTATRVTGLSGLTYPSFTGNDRIVFLDDDPVIETAPVPWTGRLTATEGNLSIRLVDMGGEPAAKGYRITVRNDGPTTAIGSYVLTNSSYQRLSEEPSAIPSLQSGEVYSFETTIAYPTPGLRIHVLSDDLADTDPQDNFVLVEDAELTRRHPLRR